MNTPAPLPVQRRRFRRALPAYVAVLLVFATLLSGLFSDAASEVASRVGLVVAALAGMFACVLRGRQTSGRRRRTWRLVIAAGVAGIGSNVWVALADADPLPSSSRVGDGLICLALVLSTAALINFPTVRRRGIDRALLLLDGAVITVSVLLITSILVYPPLLDTVADGQSVIAARLIPALDVVLVTVALLLMVRSSGADRPLLALFSSGFVMYTMSDLAFGAMVASGSFRFGTSLDLGWIAGYLLIGLAAWYPSSRAEGPSPAPADVSDARDTALVYAVVLLAGGVQVLAPVEGRFGTPQGLLWLGLVAAIGIRQTLLTRDHSTLRGNLEQRVRAQTADLRRMARQTRTLISSVGDGVYGVDARGRITFLNPSAARVLGYDARDLLGQNAHAQLHAPMRDGTPYPVETCYITEAIRDGHTALAEEDVYLRADGSSFPVEITASPVIDEDAEQAVGAVVVFRDVTQRREVDRLKNEFISVVSHELRTPLTSIRGTLGLLAGGALGQLDPRARAMAESALESSERLTRLINDILDLERIESGTSELALGTHDAAALIAASASEMRAMADGMGIRLLEGPTAGRVVADRDRVVQTLTNLIGNALKFSEPGSEVCVTARDRGREVVFSVIDSGRGIPEDKLVSIFERFEQVDSSDARQKGGTGLGLAISRGIVERHGGRIWAESTPGEGTTVSFTLPASKVRPLRHSPRVPVLALLGSTAAVEAWRAGMGPGTVDTVRVDPSTATGDAAVLPADRRPLFTALVDPIDDLLADQSGQQLLRTAVRTALGGPAEEAVVLVVESDARLGAALSAALDGAHHLLHRVDPSRHAGTVPRETDLIVVDLDSPGALTFLNRHHDTREPLAPALLAVHRTTALAGPALDALGRDVLTLVSGTLSRQNGDPR